MTSLFSSLHSSYHLLADEWREQRTVWGQRQHLTAAGVSFQIEKQVSVCVCNKNYSTSSYINYKSNKKPFCFFSHENRHLKDLCFEKLVTLIIYYSVWNSRVVKAVVTFYVWVWMTVVLVPCLYVLQETFINQGRISHTHTHTYNTGQEWSSSFARFFHKY